MNRKELIGIAKDCGSNKCWYEKCPYDIKGWKSGQGFKRCMCNLILDLVAELEKSTLTITVKKKEQKK